MNENIIMQKDIKKSNKQAERTLMFAVFSCLPESFDKLKAMVSEKFKLLRIEKCNSGISFEEFIKGSVYIPPYKKIKYEKEKLTNIMRDFVLWQENVLEEKRK